MIFSDMRKTNDYANEISKIHTGSGIAAFRSFFR
jgi:hypothetical protein